MTDGDQYLLSEASQEAKNKLPMVEECCIIDDY